LVLISAHDQLQEILGGRLGELAHLETVDDEQGDRREKASTLITSNRPVEDWGKLLGDTAAVAALLDPLLHHAHVLTCGPRSWRTRQWSDRNSS
jgi:IstB-like ATP binding protein